MRKVLKFSLLCNVILIFRVTWSARATIVVTIIFKISLIVIRQELMFNYIIMDYCTNWGYTMNMHFSIKNFYIYSLYKIKENNMIPSWVYHNIQKKFTNRHVALYNFIAFYSHNSQVLFFSYYYDEVGYSFCLFYIYIDLLVYRLGRSSLPLCFGISFNIEQNFVISFTSSTFPLLKIGLISSFFWALLHALLKMPIMPNETYFYAIW